MSGCFFNGPNGLSCSQQFVSNIQTASITVSFLLIIFSVDSKETPIALFYVSPSPFFPLFLNKLDFSPGSSVLGNPSEKESRQWRDHSFVG